MNVKVELSHANAKIYDMENQLKQKAQNHQKLMDRVQELKKQLKKAAGVSNGHHIPADENSAENKQVDFIFTPKKNRVHDKP